MSGFVCERCKRETWQTYTCDNCHQQVCRRCIVFRDKNQLCQDCAYGKEGIKIKELEPAGKLNQKSASPLFEPAVQSY